MKEGERAGVGATGESERSEYLTGLRVVLCMGMYCFHLWYRPLERIQLFKFLVKVFVKSLCLWLLQLSKQTFHGNFFFVLTAQPSYLLY